MSRHSAHALAKFGGQVERVLRRAGGPLTPRDVARRADVGERVCLTVLGHLVATGRARPGRDAAGRATFTVTL